MLTTTKVITVMCACYQVKYIWTLLRCHFTFGRQDSMLEGKVLFLVPQGLRHLAIFILQCFCFCYFSSCKYAACKLSVYLCLYIAKSVEIWPS